MATEYKVGDEDFVRAYATVYKAGGSVRELHTMLGDQMTLLQIRSRSNYLRKVGVMLPFLKRADYTWSAEGSHGRPSRKDANALNIMLEQELDDPTD